MMIIRIITRENNMEIKSDIEEAIIGTCLQIIREPLTYFSEADIQQLLTEYLRQIPELQQTYHTSVQKGKGSKSRYSTSLMHREYGGGGGRRIDIVIFSEKDVESIDDVNLMHKREYLIPEYAFELGTEKTTNTKEHIKNDLDKLQNVKNTGYLIHFYRDSTKARTGTTSREKTEKRIREGFKIAFKTIPEYKKNKVKILPILLRTYRNQIRFRGKCEIFNGKKWHKRNISKSSDLRAAILNQLR